LTIHTIDNIVNKQDIKSQNFLKLFYLEV